MFVVGANVFPHNASYNPTGPVGALAYWTADAIKNRYVKNPGPLVHGMMRKVVIVAAALLVGTRRCVRGRRCGRGEKKFEDCVACHSLDRNVQSVGPSLYGVFGRKAGSADFRYSPAMKRSGITWTPQTVDTFIADPQDAVPANRMPYAGMTSESDRADLVAYLQKTFK